MPRATNVPFTHVSDTALSLTGGSLTLPAQVRQVQGAQILRRRLPGGVLDAGAQETCRGKGVLRDRRHVILGVIMLFMLTS